MGGLLRLLNILFAPVLWLLTTLRWLWVALLAIGLPAWIYVTFIADEPVFGVENDVALGRQSQASILADPEQFPVLPAEEYPLAYQHLGRIVRNIVGAPDIEYAELFPYYDVKIIHRDDVLNAFCTPGGYIYVYSGLIHYLESEDHLAGVLGHEIAHAERRHSSTRLQREFGAQRLFEFVVLSQPLGTGDVATAAIVKQLATLSYSRDQEAEADAYSVRYLASTDYACNGTAGFFEKLQAEGDGARIPEFLSDHPDPSARIAAIHATTRELGCGTDSADESLWKAFQASLPPPAPEAAAP